LSADPRLVLLRGQCGCHIGKFSEFVTDISRYLASGLLPAASRITALQTRAQSQLKLGVLSAISDAAQSGDQALVKLFTDLQRSSDRANLLYLQSHFREAFDLYLRILQSCPSSLAFTVRAAACAWRLNLASTSPHLPILPAYVLFVVISVVFLPFD
jgi:hypothetical protein